MHGKKAKKSARASNASWQETLALASELSGVKGSSLIWCGDCQTVLVPVVYSDSKRTEVISLACLNCLHGYRIVVGILAGPVNGERPYEAAE